MAVVLLSAATLAYEIRLVRVLASSISTTSTRWRSGWRCWDSAPTAAQVWFVAVLGTGLREFQRLAHRRANHLDAVIAGRQHDVSLGLAESITSKLTALRFQARGCRDPEYFKLRIFQGCPLPDNPSAAIVL